MFETLTLFLALFVLETVLEIDNLTALQKAAAGLPNDPNNFWCRGQVPHALALGVRVSLTFFLFHFFSHFAAVAGAQGQIYAKQFGGLLLIIVACGLVLNHVRADSQKFSPSVMRRTVPQPTSLVGFLIADAFLSMDTVIAAVAMTSNFSLAVTAMICAAICMMFFHQKLHQWLKDSPRIALLAFVVIGLLGANLILAAQGHAVPKYVLLVIVLLGVWFDRVDRDVKKMRAQEIAARKQTRKPARKPSILRQETVSDLKEVVLTTVPQMIPQILPQVRCIACNAEQLPNSSLCHACGQYRFFDSTADNLPFSSACVKNS